MRRIMGKPIASVLLASVCFSISGCAVYDTPPPHSTTATSSTITAIEFPKADDKQSLRGMWASALEYSFQIKAVPFEEGAPFIADYAMSVRDAKTGIADADTAKDSVKWQSEPRSKRLLDKCSAKRARGTLVIFERSSGDIVYRGESEADRCGFAQGDFDTMAAKLASEALR